MLSILGLLAAVNTLVFMGFWYDKKQAKQGNMRVPERKLLLGAALGGWPAAKLAQRLFRHKTRKQPFGKMLNAVPLVWAIIGCGIYFAT